MALGIQKETTRRVGPERARVVTLQFATGKVGPCWFRHPAYKSHELKYVLEQSAPRPVPDRRLGMLISSRSCDAVPYLIGTEKASYPSRTALPEEHHPYGRGFTRWLPVMDSGVSGRGEEVSDAELRGRQDSLDAEDVINMQYTSGTTGFPKGVQLTHTNIVKNAFYIGECMKLGPGDRVCIPVPFFHCFGCVLGTLNTVTHEGTMVPVESFDAAEVLRAVDGERCTALLGVPTMFIAELDLPDFQNYDTSSLRTGIMAGSPCPMEVMKKVVDVMGAKEITIAYGQTESSPVITHTHRRPARTCGIQRGASSRRGGTHRERRDRRGLRDRKCRASS